MSLHNKSQKNTIATSLQILASPMPHSFKIQSWLTLLYSLHMYLCLQRTQKT